MTPEGKVKSDVKKVLHRWGCIRAGSKENTWPEIKTGWYYMPTNNGMGVHGIPDFIGFYQGEFFAIETKAPGKLDGTTPNQKNRHNEIRTVKGRILVVDNAWEVDRWFSADRPLT